MTRETNLRNAAQILAPLEEFMVAAAVLVD